MLNVYNLFIEQKNLCKTIKHLNICYCVLIFARTGYGYGYGYGIGSSVGQDWSDIKNSP